MFFFFFFFQAEDGIRDLTVTGVQTCALPISKELSMTPLRKRLIEDMTVRNFAPATQATYVQQVSLFARHFGQSPETLGPEEIRSYQLYLAMEKELAPTSISIAGICAPLPVQRDTPKKV